MLFNDTMHYNIAYGDLHASREDVETAARQAFHPSGLSSPLLIFSYPFLENPCAALLFPSNLNLLLTHLDCWIL